MPSTRLTMNWPERPLPQVAGTRIEYSGYRSSGPMTVPRTRPRTSASGGGVQVADTLAGAVVDVAASVAVGVATGVATGEALGAGGAAHAVIGMRTAIAASQRPTPIRGDASMTSPPTRFVVALTGNGDRASARVPSSSADARPGDASGGLDVPGRTVDGHALTRPQPCRRIAAPDDRRDPVLAGDDRGVSGGAAAVGDDGRRQPE